MAKFQELFEFQEIFEVQKYIEVKECLEVKEFFEVKEFWKLQKNSEELFVASCQHENVQALNKCNTYWLSFVFWLMK